MQKQNKPFSFKKTFRDVFSPPPKGDQSIRELQQLRPLISSFANSDCHPSADRLDPVPSESIGGAKDVTMGVIETSLATLQTGSALVANVPFISPVAGLILQALQMRGVRFRFLSLYDSCVNNRVK